MFANREIWTLQQIIYPLPRMPPSRQNCGAAKIWMKLRRRLRRAGIQFNAGHEENRHRGLPARDLRADSGLPAGEPFIVPGPDKAIANVITAREPAPLSAEQARALALNAMKREQINKIVQDRVKGLRDEGEDRISARVRPAAFEVS